MRGAVAQQSATEVIGIFARRIIKEVQHIVQYVGEVVTERDANISGTRYREEGKRAEYLVRIPSNGFWIDPKYVGNRARYLNHSCRPNAILEVTLTGTEIRLMVITATASIERRTYIFIDYRWDSVRVGEKGASIQICSFREACFRRTI